MDTSPATSSTDAMESREEGDAGSDTAMQDSCE